ncbi:MAG: M20/M25/M40 family metallo-hydrolase [Gemmatimonadota bacterium]|nr:M20/M25/M40 family metallo-hydrolase [Gemmatimonadota bacterium]
MTPHRLLFAARLLLSLGVAFAPPLAAQNRPLSQWEERARALLKELVEDNTTQSAGDMTAAAEAMAVHMRAAGFPAEDIVVVEAGKAKKGNLIVRYRGRNPSLKPILLLSHHDVVEANPEDWTLPPFEFIERDGMFYGRGVADNKDEGAMHLTILLRMKAEGFVPERDIIVALTTDEEGGPDNGVEWLLANRPELIDAEYALNEGGGGVIVNGTRVSNNVQAAEKKVLNLQLEVTNPGGHSSVPLPDNAIYHLARALDKVASHQFPARLNEVTRGWLTGTAALMDPEMGGAMRRFVANPSDRAAEAIISRDPGNNSRLRTTCVATMLSGGHARNALPQRATAVVNCRMLPDEDPEYVKAALAGAINNTQVTLTSLSTAQESPPSPLTPALMTAIGQVTEEMWPGLPVIPTMSTGATDGLYLRRAGIPVYGVSGLFYENANAHGMNETISAAAFYQGLEFMYRLVKVLTGSGIS